VEHTVNVARHSDPIRMTRHDPGRSALGIGPVCEDDRPMERFEVIVVGAGPAGSTTACHLASSGINTLLVERGPAPGNKNVSGGLIYAHPVASVWPDFWPGAAVERAITAHRLVMLAGQKSFGAELRDDAGVALRGLPAAYSVLRAQFDPWLAKRAEDAGAALITGVTVDGLIVDHGRVIGVRAGSDEIGADVVVVAEGSRSILLEEARLQESPRMHDVAIGVKEIIALPAATIEDRFQCDAATGTACTFVGHTAGVAGGAFLYTNRDTLSLGVVVKLDALVSRRLQPHQVLDDLKTQPQVRRLIDGGEVVEFSAQTIRRGRFEPDTRLHGDGYVVVGSAGGLLINNLLTLRGMDFAIVSGVMAARAIVGAHERGDFGAASLGAYPRLLRTTAMWRDWRTFKDAYAVMDNDRLFDVYPEFAVDVMERMLIPSGRPSKKALGALRQGMRGRVSPLAMARDMVVAARGLGL
jgi:electron transfer flavoprotein-quinone oxidoreductase